MFHAILNLLSGINIILRGFISSSITTAIRLDTPNMAIVSFNSLNTFIMRPPPIALAAVRLQSSRILLSYSSFVISAY